MESNCRMFFPVLSLCCAVGHLSQRQHTADRFTGQEYKRLETLSCNCFYLTPILAGEKEEVKYFLFVCFCLPQRNRKELCT